MSKKELTFAEVLEHFTPYDLLEEMGYVEEICFQDFSDLKDYVLDNSDYMGIELKEDYEFNILEESLFDRFIEILNKVSPDKIDKIFKKEFNG